VGKNPMHKYEQQETPKNKKPIIWDNSLFIKKLSILGFFAKNRSKLLSNKLSLSLIFNTLF
jgi:hypothetical protein